MFYLIGNSHLGKFNIHSLHANDLRIQYNIPDIKFVVAPGAAIRGLLKEHSVTGLNKKIYDIDSINTTLIFDLGQVDCEFGYYYKCCLENKKVDIDEFINSTIGIYEQFLKRLKSKIIIIGVCPTVITDNYHIYTVNFEKHLHHSIEELGITNEPVIPYENLSHIYNDNIEARNQILKKMNDAIKYICLKLNITFINMWELIAENDQIKEQYKLPNNILDHHIRPHIDFTNYILYELSKCIL